jgi:hypothetical protein
MPRTDPFRLPLPSGLPVTSRAAPAGDHGAGTQAAGRDAREWQPVSYFPASCAWPLQSRLELAALPSAVPCARLHTRQLLWEWRLAALAETVELLVSEIATNAVNASASAAGGQSGEPRAGGLPVLQLLLASDRRDVLVQIWDSSRETPLRQDMAMEAESGRGLLLVEHLSAQWGCYLPEASAGKVAWALVAQAAT